MNLLNKVIDPGAIFKSTKGGDFAILSKSDKRDSLGYQYYWNIKFNDQYGYETVAKTFSIKTGLINNPYAPSLAGVGFIGVGKHSSKIINDEGKVVENRVYRVWRGLIERCYAEYSNKQTRWKSYNDVIVDEKWHNFQNFADWYTNQPGYNLGFEIDKDLRSSEDNRIYSEETCTLLPSEINMMLVSKRYTKNKHNLPKGIRNTPSNKFSATAHCGDPIGVSRTFETLEEAVSWYNNKNREYVLRFIDNYKNILDAEVVELVTNKALDNILIKL